MKMLLKKTGLVFLFFLNGLYCLPAISGTSQLPAQGKMNGDDSVDVQTLYNGRAWRNLYYRIKGDQFLFSNDFLNGSVKTDNKIFSNLQLKYDIFNDEVIVMTGHGIIIQLNKEKLDSFNLKFNDNLYAFRRFDNDSLSSLSGYVNVFYEGHSALYAKYRKEILILAVEHKYDQFNQINKIYVRKDGKIIQISGKLEFMKLLKDKKHELKSYMKSQSLHPTKKDPESFKPVLEYYDKIRY